MKQVQIPEKLFIELVKFHICGYTGNGEYIHEEIQKKFDAMIRRSEYAKHLLDNNNTPT